MGELPGAMAMSSTCLAFLLQSARGTHRQKPETSLYSYPDLLGERSTFSLNLSRSSFISNSDSHRNLSNQLHSSARTNVDMSRGASIVLFLPQCAHVDWNWPFSREKYLKIDWSVKISLHWLIIGVEGS